MKRGTAMIMKKFMLKLGDFKLENHNSIRYLVVVKRIVFHIFIMMKSESRRKKKTVAMMPPSWIYFT